MLASIKAKQLLTAGLCAGLVACGSAEPAAYTGIASSSQLVPNRQDESGRVPFAYSTPVDWRSYTKAIVDPVTIYRAADHQFGDMSEEDKSELAQYMRTEFAKKLRARFMPALASGPNTLRVRLTLTGAETSTPVLGTLSHLDIAGGLYNSIQAVRGREGTMTGSVIYAVELYDAPTDRLLRAFITKQYPGALNIPATLGSLAAAKTGIDKGAEALVTELR